MRVQEAQNREGALEKLSQEKQISFGAFLYRRLQAGKSVRARKNADGKLYDVYPTRELLEDEFSKLMQHQATYYPDIITPATIERLHHVIFFQKSSKNKKEILYILSGQETDIPVHAQLSKIPHGSGA